jgi:5-methylcytosine-specific restriction protein A
MPARLEYAQRRGRKPQPTEDQRESHRFLCSAAWRKLRLAKLQADPLCEPCLSKGKTTLATVVHHKKRRDQHPELALDWDNLESRCRPCHDGEAADKTRRRGSGHA